MNHLIVSTRHGPLYVVGRLHTDADRPALVAMGGIWTPDDYFHELVEWFPGANVLVAPLPGMGGSATFNFKPRTASLMLEEMISALLTDRRVVVLGASTGCLATLGVQAPQVVRQVAVEPFFRTAPLWPFHRTARDMLAREPGKPAAALAAREIFGLEADRVEDQDYRGLLDGLKTPLDVIVAADPLEPERPLDRWPSLTSAEDRARLAAHSLVTMHDGPPNSGHYISASDDGQALIRRIVHQALRMAAGLGPEPRD